MVAGFEFFSEGRVAHGGRGGAGVVGHGAGRADQVAMDILDPARFVPRVFQRHARLIRAQVVRRRRVVGVELPVAVGGVSGSLESRPTIIGVSGSLESRPTIVRPHLRQRHQIPRFQFLRVQGPIQIPRASTIIPELPRPRDRIVVHAVALVFAVLLPRFPEHQPHALRLIIHEMRGRIHAGVGRRLVVVGGDVGDGRTLQGGRVTAVV
ncbi:MAG: hypothetical protein FLDDKLPJ_03570 [Phycisphaerae bacterium]|nr:hypothetical protein [Phycisphaerae bacterium]